MFTFTATYFTRYDTSITYIHTYLWVGCCSLGCTVYVFTGNSRNLLWWLLRCTWACHLLPCVVLPPPRYRTLSEWCRWGVWTRALWAISCLDDDDDADPWCVHELLATLTSLREPCHLRVSLEEALPELVVTTLSRPAWLPSRSRSGFSSHDVCGAAPGLAVASLSLRNLKDTRTVVFYWLQWNLCHCLWH
jgi:hypothetical protein